MTMRLGTVLAATVLMFGCESANEASTSPINIDSQAQRIAKDMLLVDTHIDVPYRLQMNWEDVSQATTGGSFDYPRAVAGGLNAGFMSVYTPAELEAQGRSKETAEALIDLVYGLQADAPDKFAIARSPADVREHFKQGLVSLPIGMENGSPIEGDLDNLQHFFDRGVRYITLAHGLSNHIADSSYDDNRRWNGLSDFGAKVVQEMNRLGIMIDVSHLSDDASQDVLDLSAAPVIASHSSARHFTPGWERNLSDELIERLAENGGVVMVNFGSTFLTQEAREYDEKRSKAYEEHLKNQQLKGTDALEDQFNIDYASKVGPYPFATLNDVLDHFDHIIELVGIDHVGIGSDFDGVGDSLPIGLKGVDDYPNLIRGFIDRGYNNRDIEKILGGNLMRVWSEVERYAVEKQSSDSSPRIPQ